MHRGMNTRAHVRTIRIRQDLLPAGAAISIRGGKLRQNATLGNSLKGTALRCRVRDIVVTAIASERNKREVHRHATVTRSVFLSFATWSSFVDRSADRSRATRPIDFTKRNAPGFTARSTSIGMLSCGWNAFLSFSTGCFPFTADVLLVVDVRRIMKGRESNRCLSPFFLFSLPS